MPPMDPPTRMMMTLMDPPILALKTPALVDTVPTPRELGVTPLTPMDLLTPTMIHTDRPTPALETLETLVQVDMVLPTLPGRTPMDRTTMMIPMVRRTTTKLASVTRSRALFNRLLERSSTRMDSSNKVMSARLDRPVIVITMEATATRTAPITIRHRPVGSFVLLARV